MVHFNSGIEIDGVNLPLDSTRKRDFAFVSHAHSDHVASHRKILATPETILFFRKRYKQILSRALQFGKRAKIGKVDVELFSSGHILGAAQIMIHRDDQKIVYTGDFKLKPSATVEPIEIRKCDGKYLDRCFFRNLLI